MSDGDSYSAEVATSANYVRRFISSASAIIRCAVYCPERGGESECWEVSGIESVADCQRNRPGC